MPDVTNRKRLFGPEQIADYADQANQQANQMPGVPSNIIARQTVQPGTQPNSIVGAESSIQPDKPGLPWPYKAGMIGANLFDGATTRAALSSNGSAFESNPLMSGLAKSTPGFMAAKGGMGLLQSYAMNNLAKTHPKAARIASLASMAIPTVAGLSNLSKIK